jgi:hypothetical protein
MQSARFWFVFLFEPKALGVFDGKTQARLEALACGIHGQDQRLVARAGRGQCRLGRRSALQRPLAGTADHLIGGVKTKSIDTRAVSSFTPLVLAPLPLSQPSARWLIS